MKKKFIIIALIATAVFLILLLAWVLITKSYLADCRLCGIEIQSKKDVCAACGYCTDCEWEVYGVVKCNGCFRGGDCLRESDTSWCLSCFACGDCCKCSNPEQVEGVEDCECDSDSESCSECDWCVYCNWNEFGILSCRSCLRDGLCLARVESGWCRICNNCEECCIC